MLGFGRVDPPGTLAERATPSSGFDPEPRQEHWGAPRSFVRDPAGNRVELMSAPPPTSR
jgi:hypothetical protein